MGKNKSQKATHSNRQKEAWGDLKQRTATETLSCSTFSVISVVVLATVCIVLHRNHCSQMFENDRHFSHLSSLEREMTFRTEMGLYYSYYKTMIHSETLLSGLNEIMNDKKTEYPNTINTLKRFNLYPEVVLAAAYRTYVAVAKRLNLHIMDCWQTNRGKDLPPIVSCEGMGDEFYFYINNVFNLAGISAGAIFLYGVLLSDSTLGGILAVCSFAFNHGEATRVQWTPPLRESFGYPAISVQMLTVSYILRTQKSGMFWSLLVGLLTTTFMLPWQFAQFALSTQCGALFITYMLGYIPTFVFRTLTYGLLIGFTCSYAFLFGNEMLLTSLFLSSLLAAIVICTAERPIKAWFKHRLVVVTMQSFLFLAITFGFRIAIGRLLHMQDDAHIFNLLRSKFTDYSDFHTRLYSCAAEFDFLGWEAPRKMIDTLLLPAALISCVFVVYKMIVHAFAYFFRSTDDRTLAENASYCVVVYNLIQTALFCIMAILIMRLKLFFTPHLCIMTSLLASPKFFGGVFAHKKLVHLASIVCLLASMSFNGYANIVSQLAIQGEFSHPTQENLLLWVNSSTPRDAVFAGAMPTMANLKLSTDRPVVNHPHYEDAALRDRVFEVYTMYSRRPVEEVHALLKRIGVQYYVFEYSWCKQGAKPGCSIPELYDLHDVNYRSRIPTCALIHRGELGPFKKVHENPGYTVLKV